MSTLLDHSVGLAVESAFNDNVTAPSRYNEILPDGWLEWDPHVVQGEGLRVGQRFQLGNRRVGVIGQGSGSYKWDLLSKGFGTTLQQCFGKGTSTNVSGALYQQLFESTQTNAYIGSLIAQERVVKSDGSVDVHNFTGCTAKSFEIDCQAGGLASLKVDLDAAAYNLTRSVTDGVTASSTTLTSATAAFTQQDKGKQVSGTGIPASTTISTVSSATSVVMSASATASGSGVTVTIGNPAVTPSYSTGGTAFSYAAGSATVGGTLTAPTTTALGSVAGGTSATIAGFTLSVDNGIDDGLWRIGARDQPTVGRRKATLKASMFYDATTGAILAAAQRNQTSTSLLLELDTNEAVGSGLALFQIAVPTAYINSGAIPMPKDDKVIRTDIEFEILDDATTNTDLLAVIRTSDTAL